jgi:hypothetical protein
MDIKAASLNSAMPRNAAEQAGLVGDVAIHDALHAIDRLSAIYDALQEASRSIDPSETMEARAMRYEVQHDKAMQRARDLVFPAAERLMDLQTAIEARAVHAAGLATPPQAAAEIRAALRGMSSAEREKAITKAFETGDTEILASIHGQNSLLWGGVKAPVQSRFQAFVVARVPELERQREALGTVQTSLELASGAFVKAASAWRNLPAAGRGREQAEHHQMADKALKDALA